MFLRLRCFLLTMSVAWASACGAHDTSQPGDTPDAGSPPESLLTLVADPDLPLQVERGATGTFTFKLVDRAGAPVVGALVRFAIVGRGNDASLTATEADTDSTGHVTGSIVGASTESSFQVRASSEGADSAYIDVSVSDTGFGSISVDVSYTGTRPIADYVVRLFSGMTCDDIESMTPPDRYERMHRSDESTLFEGLPAGVHFAVLAQGQDRDRVVLARACADGFTIVADETETTSLILEETPAHAAGTYNVRFAFAVATPGERVAQTIAESSAGFYSDDGATYLLDQVGAIYLRGGDAEQAAQFEEFRAAQYLDSALGAYLGEHDLGPGAALAAVGQLASEGVNHIALLATLTVPESGMLERDSLAFSAFDARFDSVAFPIPVDRVPPPIVLAQGLYSSATGALQFDSVDFTIPLGSLARAYIEGATRRELRPALIAAANCASMATWWIDGAFESDSVDGDILQIACERAIENVADSTLVSLANLDTTCRALHLSGDARVHDADHDGAVESIGENTLSGTWRPVGAPTGIVADMRVSAERFSGRTSAALR